MKRFFAALLLAALSSPAAFAVNYIDEYGVTQNYTGSYTTLTASNSDGSITTGWYMLSGTYTNVGMLTISGTVHLILADNCNWTFNNGIVVEGSNALHIYAQSSSGSNVGKLTTTGRSGRIDNNYDNGGGAGIGGGPTYNDGEIGKTAGTIVINGGIITATGGIGGNSGGGGGGAGIGGGGGAEFSSGGGGGMITINGGTVIAKGGDGQGTWGSPAAGIGGGGASDSGAGGAAGIITINGGSVTANAGASPTGRDAYDIGAGGRGSNTNAPVGSAGSLTVTGNPSIIGTEQASRITNVYGTIIFDGLTGVSTISSITVNSTSYGTATTDATGKANIYLPVVSNAIFVLTIGADKYANANITWTKNPHLNVVTLYLSPARIISVTPTQGNTPITGSIQITFNAAMNTSAGTVKLHNSNDGTEITLGSGNWSNSNKTYTASYSSSGLSYNTTYYIIISDFKDGALDGVTPPTNTTTNSYSFTTQIPQAIDQSTYSAGPYSVGNKITTTDNTYYPNDGGYALTHTYKWYRANDGTGAGAVQISGAAANQYIPVSDDFGKWICIETTPVGSGGLPGAPVKSAWIRVGVKLWANVIGTNGRSGTVTINSTLTNTTTSYVTYGDNVMVIVTRDFSNDNVAWSDGSNGGSFSAPAAASTTYTPPTSPTGDITLTVTLEKGAATDVTFPTAANLNYGLPLSSSSLSGGTPGRGAFAWESSSIVPTVVNSGYNVIFTPTDNGDYDYAGITGWDGTVVRRTVLITVNPHPLTVSCAIAPKEYDGGTNATFSIQPSLVGVLAGDAGEVSLSVGTAEFSSPNVGSAIPINFTNFTISGAKVGNYTLTQPTGVTGIITPATLTITPNPNQQKAYGASNPTYTYTVSGWKNTSDMALLTGALDRYSGENAGQYNITKGSLALTLPVGASSHNYSINFVGGVQFTINKKDITVSGGTITPKEYDGNTTATVATIAFSGMKSADSLAFALDVDYEVQSAQFSSPSVSSSKSVTVTVALKSSLTADNYNLTNGSSYTLSGGAITRKQIAIQGGAVEDKVYDGSASATVTELNFFGTLPSETFTKGVHYTVSNATFSDGANVGDNKPITATVALNSPYSSYYTITGIALPTGNITPATLTIVPNSNQSKIYGESEPLPFGYEVIGWKGADASATPSVLSGALTRDPGEDAGTYPITQGNLTANSNYDIYFIDTVQLTINKRNITVNGGTITPKEYDGNMTAAVPTVTFDNLKSGESPFTSNDYTVQSAQFGDAAVGSSKSVTVNVALKPNTKTNNYNLTNGSPAILSGGVITKRQISIANSLVATKAYDGNATATLAGELNFNNTLASDPFSTGTHYSVDAITFNNAYVGSGKPVTVSVTLKNNAANCYEVTNNGGAVLSGNINPATLVITPYSGQEKTYGESAPTLGFYVNGWQGSDATANPPLLTGEPSCNEVKAGRYAIARGSLAVNSTSYAIDFTDTVMFTINKRPITVSGGTVTPKEYDDSRNAAVTAVTFDNLLAGDLPFALNTDYTVQSAQFGDAGVGSSKNVAVTVALTDSEKAKNYTLSNDGQGQLTGVGVINKKTISVLYGTVEEKIYAGPSGSLVATVTSLTFSDGAAIPASQYSVSAAFTSETAEDGKVVTATVTLTSPAVDRYVLTSPTCTLLGDIKPATLVVRPVEDQHKAYGDADPTELSFDVSGGYGETFSFTGKLRRAAGDEVGQYAIDRGNLEVSNPNYRIDFMGDVSFAITKKTISVIGGTAADKQYDGATGATVASVTFSGASGLQPGIDYSVVSAEFAGAEVGNGKSGAVTVALTPGSNAASRYELANGGSGTLTGNIVQRPITILGGAVKQKIYDGSNSAEVTSVTFDNTMETLTPADYNVTSATFSSVDVADNKSVTVAVALTGNAALRYTLSPATSSLLYGHIKPATLIIQPYDGQQKVFGSGDPVLTYASTGWKGADDDLLLEGSLGREPGDDAGEYIINRGALSLAAGNNNYTISFVENVPFTITPSNLTIVGGTVALKTYNGDRTAEVAGLTFSPNVTLVKGYDYTIGNPAFDTKHVGADKHVTVTVMLQPGTLTAQNYTLLNGISCDTLRGAINPRPISVTGGYVAPKTYDGEPGATVVNVEFSADVVDNLKSGEDYSVSGGEFLNANVGDDKPVSVTVTLLNTQTAQNYTLSNEWSNNVLKGNITPAQLDVSPKLYQSKTYGDPNPPLEYNIMGLKGSDPETLVTGQLVRAAGDSVGTYLISQGTVQVGSNYSLNFIQGVPFTITKKPISISSATVRDKIYDGNRSAEVTEVAFDGVTDWLAFGDDYTVTGAQFNDKSAANNKPVAITVALQSNSPRARNYSLSGADGQCTGTAAISKREIVLDDGAIAPKNYDGAVNAIVTDITFRGTVETLTSADYEATATFTTATAGNNKPVLVTVALKPSEAASNYTLTGSAISLNGNIAPATLTVRPRYALHKSVGESDPLFNLTAIDTIVGWKNGEGSYLLSGAMSREAGETAGAYSITPGNLSAGDNYSITLVGGVKFYVVGLTDCFVDKGAASGMHPYPVAVINDGALESCENDITLTASVTPPLTTGASYRWYEDGQAHQTLLSRYVVSPNADPSIPRTDVSCYLVAVDADGCESQPSAPVKVNIRANPNTPVISSPNPECADVSSITIPANFVEKYGEYYAYQWFIERNGAYDSAAVTHQASYKITDVSTANAGWYKLKVSNQYGCWAESEPKKVTIHALPPTPFITPGGDQHLCANDSILLTAYMFGAPDGAKYRWAFNDGNTSIPIYNESLHGKLNVTTPGVYSVVSISAENCQSAGNGMVTADFYPVPVTPDLFPAGDSIQECATSAATLTALRPGATSYTWYKYNVDANNNPVGAPITIPGETDSAYTVDKNGYYSVSANIRHNEWRTCYSSVSAPKKVTLYRLPMPPRVTADKLLQGCAGEVITLTASLLDAESEPAASYAWYKGDVQTAQSTDSVLKVAQSAGVAVYTAVAVSSDGCRSEPSAPKEITIHPRPTVMINDGERESCGGRVMLSAAVFPEESGYTYSWHEKSTKEEAEADSNAIADASTSPSYVVMPNVTLTEGKTRFYSVYAINKYDCRSDDPSQTVEVNIRALPPTPAVTLPSVCEKDDALMTATPAGAGDYRWLKRNGNIFDTISITSTASLSMLGVSMAHAGLYAVEITNTWGCTSARGEATLAVKNLPEVNIRDTSVCEDWTGVGADFATPKGGKYTGWGCNADSVFIPQDVHAGNATITYIYTGPNGCTNTDTKTIEIIPLPNTPIVTAAGSTSVCEDSIVVELQVRENAATVANHTYQWYKDGFVLPGEVEMSYVANKAGEYAVRVCNKGLCWAANPSDPVTVSVLALPEAPVIATQDPLMCPGGATTLFVASEERGIFQWYKGDSRKMEKLLNEIASTYSASEVGQYAVDLIGQNGCRSPMSNALTVGEYPLPLKPEIVSSQPTLYANLDYKLLVKTPSDGEQYEWYKNDFSIDLTANAFPVYGLSGDDTGRYTVRAVDEHGCYTWSDDYLLMWADAQLFIPNIFTPNGDGINDYFQILGLEDYVENSLEIITKLGRVIFSQKNYYNTWNGDGWPNDVYYYTLKLKREDGATITQTGYIHLKR